MKHFNLLSPAEAERLALLAEECGETIQIIGKILRHGYDSSNPNIEIPETNRSLLIKELGDIRAATSMLFKAGDIDASEVSKARTRKLKKVKQYLHHQP